MDAENLPGGGTRRPVAGTKNSCDRIPDVHLDVTSSRSGHEGTCGTGAKSESELLAEFAAQRLPGRHIGQVSADVIDHA